MRNINITPIIKTLTGKDVTASLPDIYLINIVYKDVLVETCVIEGATKNENGPGWKIPKERTFKSATALKQELLDQFDKIDQQVTNYDEFINWLDNLG